MKMKKIAYWFIGCLVGLTACQWNVRQVEGNGTIIQKEIPIADYKYVSATGNNLEIQYTRSDEAPALSVSCDENIWPLVEIRVSNDTLTIEPKPGEILMSPTHFVVQTCSKELATVNLAGDVDFAVQDSLKSNRLTVNMAGKCLISAQNLDIHHLELNLAGKCETDLHGKAENVELNLAGKCDYEALSLETGSLKCNTAGSCSLQVFVNDRIELHPVGICNLSYKGNPQIVQEGVNVGNIKQITE